MIQKKPENMPQLTVIDQQKQKHIFEVPEGSNLRNQLLNYNLSPYVAITQKLNCGGSGICATCGVVISEGEPEPRHWHDKAAKRFRYPRLSCQITVEADMTVELIEKVIWGKRIDK
ncbi:MAG: 2Fe-2S iron-sulfur cluster binding domain-containing protein [Bacteroidota bacterium]